MKYPIAALAVLSLAFAAPALAHNPVGSASQVCNEDGTVTLTASFENQDFDGETAVTATDSQAGDLGVGTAPATFSSDFPGPARGAGTVSFAWEADNGHNGTVEASYEAVAGCEGPPPPVPPDNPPPPENPPIGIEIPGGPPPNGESPPPDSPDLTNPKPDTLPFSGPPPVVPVLMIGLGLLGAGIAIRRLSRG